MAQPVQGSGGGDSLFDTAGNDKLLGHSGDDIFYLSTGRDDINGQGGNDTAVFIGSFFDYVVSTKDTGNLKTTVIGNGEIADLKNVETLLFDNGIYSTTTGAFTANTVSVVGGGTVTEGGDLVFTITRTGDLSRSVDVFYTLGGSATGSDLAGPLGTHVTFAAGQDTATVTLHTLNDGVFEGNETLDFQLTADPGHFVIAGSTSVSSTILDAQTPPALPQLHISNATAAEGSTLVFHVSIDAPVDHDITFSAFTDTGIHPPQPGQPNVNFGTATAGNLPGGDYNGFTPTTFTIPAGQTGVDISVYARPDALIESAETMSLRLTNASGATIGSGIGLGRGVGTIQDATQIVSYYADANNVTEGNDLTFHFHRDGDLSSGLDVRYWIGTLPSGGATPGQDFTADNTTFSFVAGVPGAPDFMTASDHWADPSMIVHFAPGQSDATLVFHTVDDGVDELFGEAFTVQYDFQNNAPGVQVDFTKSTADYMAAYPDANPTQVNIGHIVDPLV